MLARACEWEIACWDFLDPLRWAPALAHFLRRGHRNARRNVTPLEHTQPLSSTSFTRPNLQLHALLLENQPWFCARDIGRLMGVHLSDRMVSKLEQDQRRVLWIEYFRPPEKQRMLSESGVYALLVYHYVPSNRLLREWLTHQVVPTLRDAQQSENSDRPTLSLLDWPQMSLRLLHWQGEPWIRLRDMPCLLQGQQQTSWWRKVSQFFMF